MFVIVPLSSVVRFYFSKILKKTLIKYGEKKSPPPYRQMPMRLITDNYFPDANSDGSTAYFKAPCKKNTDDDEGTSYSDHHFA